MMEEELELLAAKIDGGVYACIEADVSLCFKNPPADLRAWYKPMRKVPSKDGYSNTLRTKCSIRPEKASFKCWNGDRQPMSIDQIKLLDWPSSTFAA